MLIGSVGDELKTLDSLQFKFSTIEAATNKFSSENEIGKGGFGIVYKVIAYTLQMCCFFMVNQ